MSGCDEFLEKLGEYVDNMLDRAGEEAFLSHLDGCPACRAELEAERALIENLQGMKVVDPGTEFTGAVMGRICAPFRERTGLLQRSIKRIEAFSSRHRRLAWSPMLIASLIAAFYIPALLETGTVDALSAGSRVLGFMVNPLAELVTSLSRAIDVAGPLLGALYLAVKVVASFVYTLVSTRQVTLVLFASVLVVMTTSLGIFFKIALEKRRIYYAEPRI